MEAATLPPDAHYTAREVAQLTRLAVPTVYELARREPDRFGAVRYGRAVRFRRAAIDRLVGRVELHASA